MFERAVPPPGTLTLCVTERPKVGQARNEAETHSSRRRETTRHQWDTRWIPIGRALGLDFDTLRVHGGRFARTGEFKADRK